MSTSDRYPYRIALRAFAVGVISCAFCIGLLCSRAYAQTADELRAKIADSQKQLLEIEREIKQYESELNQVGAEKKTLQSAIRELDLSRKKIQTDIRATEQKITSTDLEIEELEREIEIKDLEVGRNRDAIAGLFQNIDTLESTTLIELVLGHDSLAEVWDAVSQQAALRDSLRKDIMALEALRREYEAARGRSLAKRDTLDVLKGELSGQKSSLDQTRGQKDTLLGKTKSRESNYQALLAEKKAAREKFEKEMAAYESQLKFILDPSTIPAAGSGVLRWPFEADSMARCASLESALGNPQCITQYFGDTEFARSGAYNGKGHNGVDFGVPPGTKVIASLGGTVIDVGNTDAVSGCYSYGKWVLVKHGNGLSTMYGHLSSISVSPGQSVSTGQLLGYSGNTGYSTGPHLHFTVYASGAVSVKKLGDFTGKVTGCSAAPMPVSAYSGYLDPISYL